MGHMCGKSCKRKQDPPIPCAVCPLNGGRHPTAVGLAQGRIPHATAHQVGMAVDMYFDGLSYRRTAENIGTYTGRPTTAAAVYNWVKKESKQANEFLADVKIPTGGEWVADELAVKVGGRQMWLFNVMDADTRFLLAAHLSPTRTSRAAATAMAMARDRAAQAPQVVKTDGLASYNQGIRNAFPGHQVKHLVSQGIRAVINNNLSERLQGTLRDRDKTLRGMGSRDTGQEYIDGLVVHYNFFRPHGGLDGTKPAEAAGASIPFTSWRDVAAMHVKDVAEEGAPLLSSPPSNAATPPLT